MIGWHLWYRVQFLVIIVILCSVTIPIYAGPAAKWDEMKQRDESGPAGQVHL